MRFVIPSATPEPEAPAPEPHGPRGGITPAYLRQQLTQRRLRNSGGKRQSFNLTEPAKQALAAIRERDGHLSDTDAVIAALIHYAKRKPK